MENPLVKLGNLMVTGTISALLQDDKIWDSLIVNRRKPHTYRVFTYLPTGDRICLHHFHKCSIEESFIHPHPWSAAFTILEGAYVMQLGLSKDRFSKPKPVAITNMVRGSYYEISNPLTWHAITPLRDTYTVMLNEPAWDKDIAHTEVRVTAGKDLDKMQPDDLSRYLDKFREMLS